jgi:GMP synthase (glutamine-hydrolysing)|tara:strand:- start:1373 stop:2926 length:1554 start_codon:yes stop_codon:yes gene_type:complete
MITNKNKVDKILVLDFGAQYAHLISRRIRDAGVYSELIPHNTSAEEIKKKQPSGIILSGGPRSVDDKDAILCDPEIYRLRIPTLGICYGLQLITHQLKGKVTRKLKREYGRVSLHIDDKSDLFKDLPEHLICWMSHADTTENLPRGFETIAHTANSSSAAIRHPIKKIFGVQFHPEVAHTEKGSRIIKNFLFEVCGCKSNWSMKSFIESSVEMIRKQVKEEQVLCALSGGVDSSVTALLIQRAIGNNLTCIFIDHGLLRKGESEQVVETFKENFKIKMVVVDASKRFLECLKDVEDPEMKRIVIGNEFIKVFEEEGRKLGKFQWLAQGTLYPDVIESSGDGSPASKIKTHHNVGGLPEKLPFKLLEPLRNIYKDEVRKLASLLEIPKEIVERHPFPGPGMAVRVIGAITDEKLRICREASWILEEELKDRNIYRKVWQSFAVVGDDKVTGVLGDERNYGYMVTIRIVESVDAMTADWARLPYSVLQDISNRITNEVRGVTWVTYAISSKPPSTIEPQ